MVSRHSRSYQLRLFALLGGKCEKCDEYLALQIHHVERESGEFQGHQPSIKTVKADPSRFKLFCQLHHIQEHHPIQMGSVSTGTPPRG